MLLTIRKKAIDNELAQLHAAGCLNMKKSNRLYYFDTETEVLMGDVIIYQTLIMRRKKLGRVSYIPEKTGRELQKEKKNCDDWLIEFDDKTMTGWIYSPEDLQPPKRLEFVTRGNDEYKGISSSELEKIEQSLEENASWLERLLPSLFVIAFFIGIVFITKSCTS